MNRQRARELLPIIQAFAEGKTIQFRNSKDSKWADVEDASWFSGTEYRIKPEPMEVWIVKSKKTGSMVVANDPSVWDTSKYEVNHFREVTE